jgi:predicted DNA-binding protein
MHHINFTPEIEAQLNQLVTATGRTHEALVNELLAAQLDELMETRETLNSRYDDLKSGRVQPTDGETLRRRAFARIEDYRAAQAK